MFLDPNRAPLRIALGNALYAAGRYREADEHIRAALRLSPDNEDLRQFLERIQLKLSEGS